MTYHHQLPKEFEFNIFDYLKTGKNVEVKTNKVYVRIDELFTSKMCNYLLRNKLPEGTTYSVHYFVFDDVDTCLRCVLHMYETLYITEEFNEAVKDNIHTLRTLQKQ